MKLKSKEWFGSRVKKLYDSPLTAYQPVLDSVQVAAADKETLRREYQRLNPAALKREIRKLQKRVFACAQKQAAHASAQA